MHVVLQVEQWMMQKQEVEVEVAQEVEQSMK
jgi:hypothetical protein